MRLFQPPSRPTAEPTISRSLRLHPSDPQHELRDDAAIIRYARCLQRIIRGECSAQRPPQLRRGPVRAPTAPTRGFLFVTAQAVGARGQQLAEYDIRQPA